MKSLKIAIAVAFTSGIASAYAAGHTIKQHGKMFSESGVTLKKGEEIDFLNDDTIAHNIVSTTPGNTFNLGLVHPGNARNVKFLTAGTINVFCAIHPTMKMTVTVTE